MPAVQLAESNGLMTVTLNRPEKLNALNEEVRSQLHETFTGLLDRPEVRVVTIRGAGRAFSSGADLADRTPMPEEPVRQRAAASRWQRLLDTLERLPQATVAALHGHTIGGAVLLAAACDLRLAAEDVSISIPELALGIPLTWAGLPRLSREIGVSRTRDLVMTGRPVGASEALSWGLVHRVVATTELERAASDLAVRLLEQPPAALAMTVDALRALGRAQGGAELAWADPDILRWSLRDIGGLRRGDEHT